jgi:hypothetical protein
MPVLLISCPVTGKPVPTGLGAGRGAADVACTSMAVHPCPHCDRGHVWARADAYFEGEQPPTPTYREAVLEGGRVDVDGRRFIACELRDCTLVYSGGEGFEFLQTRLRNCRWRVEGAAWRTVEFLRGVRHGPGGQGDFVL